MLSSLLTQFRQQYPQGSLTSDLLTIHDGLYVVRVCVGVDNLVLASGLGANTALEMAEDTATTRALERLGLAESPNLPQPAEPVEINRVEAPAAAIAPPIQTDGTPPPPSPELAPPPLSLVPPVLDQNLPEPSAAALPVAAGATSSLPPKIPALPADLPNSVEAPANGFNEFADLGTEPAAIDLSDIIAQTDVELQRLGWGVTQGREFLEKTYGKRSRHDLTDDELLEFLLFLETQSPAGS